MRMKKLMILAVAAIGLVACSKAFDVNTTEGSPIGFGTWADVMTKRTPTATIFANGDDFNVFGSKVVSSTPYMVFNGDVVTKSGENWNYTPARFWDPSASGYTFYAISPAGLLPADMTDDQKTTAATTGAFSTKELTFDGTVAYDVLVSKKTPVAPANFNDDVNLDFQHVASLVDVKIKKSYALKDATVTVTAISLENIVKKGTYNVASYVSTPGTNLNKPVVAVANWVPAASEATGSFTGNTGTVGQYGYADVPGEAISGEAFEAFPSFVAMPQNLVAANGANPQQIKISYTIVVGGETITHSNKIVAFSAFDTVDNKVNTATAGDPATWAASAWNPNTHYIYTLTLDANKIDFTASITDWSDTVINGYYNLVQ